MRRAHTPRAFNRRSLPVFAALVGALFLGGCDGKLPFGDDGPDGPQGNIDNDQDSAAAAPGGRNGGGRNGGGPNGGGPNGGGPNGGGPNGGSPAGGNLGGTGVDPSDDPIPGGRTLGLNDLSILLPGEGNPPDFRNLPRLSAQGRGGALLPRAVYDRLPQLAPQGSRDAIYQGLRVVAIRFDSCFKAVSDDACLPMIRLVAQPVAPDGALVDAALHLFYPMGDAEFGDVVDTLRDLRSLAPEADVYGPLAVHPALRAQGLDGPYGSALRALLTDETGAERLSQVTFMTRDPGRGDHWSFGGFTVQNARSNPPQMTGMQIAEVDAPRQRVDLANPLANSFRYDVRPLGVDHGRIQPALDARAAEQASVAAKSEALTAFRVIENPHLAPVGEVQCASCHLAAFVRPQLEGHFGATSSTAAFAAPGIDLRVTGTAQRNPRSLRAFGWFGPQPAISPRVINDTAAALVALEARFPAR